MATDQAGNVGAASTAYAVLIDTTAPAVTVALARDSGISSTDRLTNTATLTGGGDPNAVVTLTEGSTVLGTATANGSGVWSFTPAGLAQGAHTVVVTETDLAGNTGTASLSITYDTIAPVVTLALVTDSGSSATDNYSNVDALSGTAEANSVVTIRDVATVLGTATANGSGHWLFTPTGLAQGAHTLVASQTDAAGNIGLGGLNITYDTVAPVLTMALASDTGSSATDKLTFNAALAGYAEHNRLVTFTDGGVGIGSTTTNGQGAWSFTPTGLTQGAHTIVASQTDQAGNTGSTSFTFTYDSVAPVVTETLTSDTGRSASDGITSNDALHGTADANAVVTIRDGTTVLGTTTASPTGAWSFTPSSLSQGAHTLVASTTDAAGNVGSASLAVTYLKTPPVVTIMLAGQVDENATEMEGPAWGLGWGSDDYIAINAVTGTGLAGAVVTLSEYGVAGTLGTVTANASGVWSYTLTGLSQGAHNIVASETDAAGNIGSTGRGVFWIYDTLAPTITVALASDTGVSATDKISANVALVGTADGGADAGDVVTIAEGAHVLGTATVSAAGAWTFNPTGLSQGAHTLSVTETDTAGNVGTQTLAFTYDSLGATGVAAALSASSLGAVQGSAGLVAGALAGLSEVGGPGGDTYSYSLNGGSSAGLGISSAGVLSSSGLAGKAGGRFYTAIANVTDTTNGVMTTAAAVDVVVGSSGAETINLRSLGVAMATPSFIYGLAGNDVISGAGMTAGLTFVGGAGADTMTGGSGVNTYAYAAASESTASAMDIITNFNAAHDVIDLTAMLALSTYAGRSASPAAGAVSWQQSGGNTLVYANTGAATMEIELLGTVGLSAANFHLTPP